MARTLETFAIDPTQLEFFELARAPFAALTEPDQHFQSEQYGLLMEHLEYAATNADSLVVVCGADGSGKSTLIRQFMAAILDQVSCVLIEAASDQGAVPFYSTLLNQIGFGEITGTEGELRNITKEFLVCRGIAGDHVLVIVDNTHLANPRTLEEIRRLCEVRIKDRRAVSLVLFGNADIMRVVDAPAMRQTVFSSHVGFNIRNYSEHETAGYIRHRLELAGAKQDLQFPDAVSSLIHRYSGGIPRRINKLCQDVLQEAHLLQSRSVTTEIVRAVISKHQHLPHVVPLTGKGRRKSDPRVTPGDTTTDAVDPGASQNEIAELTARVAALESSKALALRELQARDNAILSLRAETSARRKEAEDLARSLANHAAIIARQNQELSHGTSVLQDNKASATRLAADLHGELQARNAALADLERRLKDSQTECALVKANLETERAARSAAQMQLVEATAAIQELSKQEAELQATVRRLDAELESAREQAFAAYALGKNVTMLQEALEERTSDLNARTVALANLEQLVKTLNTECESLRSRAAAAQSRQGAVAETTQAGAGSAAEDHAYSSHIVALYDRSLRKIPAYRTLRKHDPAFYDSLIRKYQTLVGQDLSDQQINDSLRAEQARWMDRKLPGAADGAVVAYARLLVDQLGEFLVNGTEPCLSLLVPRADPDKNKVPVYSGSTRERELDILNMVLATYDDGRALPVEREVWPLLEPIFAALFEEYGADNVAAIENSFDPKRDRALLFNVSKTLYSRILDLPEPAAAAALRWMISVK